MRPGPPGPAKSGHRYGVHCTEVIVNIGNLNFGGLFSAGGYHGRGDRADRFRQHWRRQQRGKQHSFYFEFQNVSVYLKYRIFENA